MPPCVVEFRNVKKAFGATVVLDGLSLSVERGKITTIIGQSGVGKSVLLRHIAGLLLPDSGEVLFCGVNVLRMTREDRRQFKSRFSFMFQNMALFDSLNIYRNIAMPLEERGDFSTEEIRKRVVRQIEELDLRDVLDKYPSQISGGMRKRVALARALITEPELILFDEPATGLDPIRKNSVHNMILRYQRLHGFTAIMVSHEIPEVFSISHRVAVLDEGRIIHECAGDEIQGSQNRRVQQLIQGKENEADIVL